MRVSRVLRFSNRHTTSKTSPTFTGNFSASRAPWRGSAWPYLGLLGPHSSVEQMPRRQFGPSFSPYGLGRPSGHEKYLTSIECHNCGEVLNTLHINS
jgi:hypothetical protein